MTVGTSVAHCVVERSFREGDHMNKASLILISSAVVVCFSVLQGCSAGQTQTEQQTTTTRTDPDDPDATTTTTKTDTQTNSAQPDSVLGATANAIGTVVAAPFRLVGDALEIVF